MFSNAIRLPFLFVVSAPFLAGSASALPRFVSPRVAYYSLFQDTIPAAGFDRDADFARRLAASGDKKNADWVIAKLKASPSLTEPQKAELTYVEASNFISLFEKERDFEKAKAVYEQAKKAIEEFIKIAPKGPSLTKATYQNGDLDRQYGEKIIEQIRKEASAEKVTALRAEGEKAFQAATKYFAERRDELRKNAEAQGRDLKEDNDYQVASYALPNTYLSFAYLYPPGDSNREARLRSADSRFEEYVLDGPEGQMAYYDAYVKWGNARRDLGKPDEAVDCYQQALELLYFRDQDTGEKHVLPPNDADLTANAKFLIIEAVTEASRMWNQKKQYDQVIQFYTDVRIAMPQLERESLRALELVYEAAVAYEGLGKKDQAKIEAKRVFKAAPADTAVGAEARDLMTRLGESIESSEEVTLIQVVGSIERHLSDGNYPEAIRAFQQSRDRWRGTLAEKKFWGDLLVRGGIAYQLAGRSLEAYLLYTEVGERFPNFDKSKEALKQAVVEACKVWKTTKAAWGEPLAQEPLDKLNSAFSDAPETQEAQQMFLQTQLLVGGKKQIDLAKIGEDQLKTLSKTEPKFGRIVYDTALRYYRSGQAALNDSKLRGDIPTARDGAERCFDLYLEWAKAQQTIDAAEIAKIEERTIATYVAKAEMWLWDPGSAVEKSLNYLQQLEEKVAKAPAIAKAKFTDIEKLKTRAYLKQNKLDQAMLVADGMYTKEPTSPKTAWTLKRIADVSYNMMRAEKDAKKKESLAESGLKYYKNWVVSCDKQQAQLSSAEYNEVADRVFQFGLIKNNVAWPESRTYFSVDISKFSHAESAQMAADLYLKALAANEVSPSNGFVIPEVRYKRGQILGLLLKFKDLAAEYAQIVKDSDLIDQENKIVRPTTNRKALFLNETLVNDLAWANAQLALQGDKDAAKEAQRLASYVIASTTPKGNAEPKFDFWYARYVTVFSMVKNGERALAQEQLKDYRRTDRDLDNGKFGFKEKFEALEQQLK